MNSEISTVNSDPKAFKFNLSERFRGYLPVVVDVETAGFDPKVNALLEIALMTVTPDEKGFLHPGTLMSACIRPFEGSELRKENLDFLGIDPFDESRNLQDEATVLPLFFKAVKKEMKDQGCKRAILVGHNGNFDLGFVLEAAKRIGWEKKCPFHPFSILDTASLSALVTVRPCLQKPAAVQVWILTIAVLTAPLTIPKWNVNFFVSSIIALQLLQVFLILALQIKGEHLHTLRILLISPKRPFT